MRIDTVLFFRLVLYPAPRISPGPLPLQLSGGFYTGRVECPKETQQALELIISSLFLFFSFLVVNFRLGCGLSCLLKTNLRLLVVRAHIPRCAKFRVRERYQQFRSLRVIYMGGAVQAR